MGPADQGVRAIERASPRSPGPYGRFEHAEAALWAQRMPGRQNPKDSAEQQRERGHPAAADDQRGDGDPGDQADAPIAALAEIAVVLAELAHAAGSVTVGPNTAGSVPREVSRSSSTETVNTSCTSSAGSVSVTPIRSTG